MIRRLSGLVCAAMAVAVGAHAQTLHHRTAGIASDADKMARHESMQKQQAEDLRVILRLRPDQEPALKAFLAAHEPARFEHRAPMSEDPMTTPQRLEAMAELEGRMRAQHERMRHALGAFYAVLSPEQQKVFDALQRQKGPGPGMGMHDGPWGAHAGPRMVIRRHGPVEGPPPLP